MSRKRNRAPRPSARRLSTSSASASLSLSLGLTALVAAGVVVAGRPAAAQTAPSAGATAAPAPAMEVTVEAKRLDQLRDAIAPSLGATTHTLDRKAVESQAQGANAGFNQTLLRAPGVAQDSFGQIHVRGDHSNVQYRINGVLIPEGIRSFGQVFDTRIAERVSLITGALPAQYGYRTAGIIDIETKNGAYEEGGELAMYGGSYGTINPSAQAYGSAGKIDYFLTGNYLQNKLGIESPDGNRDTLHNNSLQGKGFGLISGRLDPDTRLSLMAGHSNGMFQIPNRRGIAPSFAAQGQTTFDSALLNDKQRELNQFGALTLEQTRDDFSYQTSLFTRYSSLLYKPDQLGDLMFNGVASRVYRNAFTWGAQGDSAWKVSSAHTLRQGLFFSSERAIAKNDAFVFNADDTGAQLSDTPVRILDGTSKWGYLYGVYLQDEWKATDRLTVNFGVRFDYYDAFVSDHEFSPRLNAVYQLTEKTSVHAGYSRYFTPPRLELLGAPNLARFAGTTNAGENGLAAPVVPQKDHYFDLGVAHKLTDALTLGVDGYYRDVDHLLDEGRFGQALVFTPFNYRRAEIYGIELTAAYRQDGLSAYANFAWSRARAKGIESQQYNFDADLLAFASSRYVSIDHDQRFTGSFGAAYDWDGTRFYGDAIAGSGLRRGFANTQTLPGYIQVNTGVVQRFTTQWLGDMQARFDVLNLFDERYQLRDGTGIGVGQPQFGIRRAFFAGLSKTF